VGAGANNAGRSPTEPALQRSLALDAGKNCRRTHLRGETDLIDASLLNLASLRRKIESFKKRRCCDRGEDRINAEILVLAIRRLDPQFPHAFLV
jgi:hypothetical protein